ncbi:MAG TPA: hypothetical protein VNB91_11425 [Jatrophihabitantaceae bacterium]|jgi:hypothetical protein|nr:hypothetical protein [Jatrophihabitantaceae bacterium]
MKRILLLISAVLLTLAPAASARVVELGAVPNSTVKPSCPADPCEAAVRVSAIQGRAAGGRKNPYYIRKNGYIVAFTVQLSKPTDEQITFFNDNFGSPAQLRLSVLRRGDTHKTRLNYRLISQTALFDVDKYLGSSPTFVLNPPLRVKKTNWIAITVPTWAPIFANNLTNSDWWRSSRAKGKCEPPRSLDQFALDSLREVSVFGCTYHGARLLYTATYVPDPQQTVKSDQSTPN